MNVELRKITEDNWIHCISLKVAKDQERFVASNVYSVAESKFDPEATIAGIYYNEKMVGFTMYGINADTNQFWIIRLMVGEAFQGKGYGRAALKILIGIARDSGYPDLYLSYVPGNERAEKLYTDIGFRPTGEVEHGEIVVCLRTA